MEINKEQKEAIEFIKDLIAWDVRQDLCPNKEECENLETLLNLIEKLQKENEKYKQFFDLMLRLDSDYFMNCGDEETNELVDEILKLESE